MHESDQKKIKERKNRIWKEIRVKPKEKNVKRKRY